jgi:intracellular septation protein
MKLLFDFLPILVFFIAYKFFGIYIATAAAIIISVLQVGIHWIRHRNVSSLQLISLVLIIVLGGSTLLFHNEVFIKWKPTALYWALSIFFFGSQIFGSRPCMQRLMESSITLPRHIWLTLNSAWAIFFGLMGILNLYVAYHFSTNTWVNFKLFGMLGLTLLFAIAQAIYLSKHLESSEKS